MNFYEIFFSHFVYMYKHRGGFERNEKKKQKIEKFIYKYVYNRCKIIIYYAYRYIILCYMVM